MWEMYKEGHVGRELATAKRERERESERESERNTVEKGWWKDHEDRWGR